MSFEEDKLVCSCKLARLSAGTFVSVLQFAVVVRSAFCCRAKLVVEQIHENARLSFVDLISSCGAGCTVPITIVFVAPLAANLEPSAEQTKLPTTDNEGGIGCPSHSVIGRIIKCITRVRSRHKKIILPLAVIATVVPVMAVFVAQVLPLSLDT